MVDLNERGKWANKAEFLLSCLGYAIGFGNMWRFPYLCYRNGGGAFLIPYLIMLFLCGIPLFFMETSLGQFSGTSCITVFKIAPIFKGPSTSRMETCTHCEVTVPASRFQGHVRSLVHKEKASLRVGEGMEVIQTAFKQRVVSVRIHSQRYHLDFDAFFAEVKKNVEGVVAAEILRLKAVKVNLEVFALYVHPVQEVHDIKSFNTPYQVLNDGIGMDVVYEHLTEILKNKAAEFQEKDSGVGYAIVIINFICTSYYFVILAYPLVFIVNCFRKVLPWEDCSNSWNTGNCVKITSGYHSHDDLTNSTSEKPYTSSKWNTPAEEFFHNQVLQISSGIENFGTIVWPLFTCTVISWLVVYLCIARGVKSIGKVVYFTATFPSVILFAFLVRGFTLPGAWEGVKFYIYPQWNELLNLKVWVDAAAQIFYSLGPGWGGMINMASFNDFRNNNKRDSVIVPVMNCGMSILAGFVVFSVLGFMAHETGLSVGSVTTGGPGLAFVTYPEAITMMPLPHLWAILLFFMFFLLGIDSTFVSVEVIISSLLDEFPETRQYKGGVTFGISFIMLLFSFLFVTNGGMYLLQLLDWYCASIPVILICLVEIISVSWTYGAKRFVFDIEFMLQERLEVWWVMSWKYISPLILMFILVTTLLFNTRVTYNGQKYPEWSIVLGWLSCLLPVIWIPIIALLKLNNVKGSFKERLKSILKETDCWGPSTNTHRQEWMKELANQNTKRGNSEVSMV